MGLPQGARSFPAPYLAVAGGPTLVCVCSPHCRHPTSSWVARPWHTPVCHQGERGRAAGMIAARVTPPLPRRWGMSSCVHCMGGRVGLQQGSNDLQSRVLVRRAGQLHYTRFPPHPNRAIYFFLWDSTARVTRLLLPTGARMGQVSSTQTAGRNARSRSRASRAAAAAAAAPARVGTLSGWRAVGAVFTRCDAMRSKGIEAIFRAACGRGYSRTWTQRILGRYAED